MTDSLILTDTTARDVIFPPEAVSIRDNAIEKSSLIARVTNAEQNDEAIEAQRALKEVVSVMEKCRKLAKEPALNEGRRIDSRVAEFLEPAVAELNRIARVTSDFAALELAKRRAAENAENERLAAIERQREAELAKAKTLEQHQDIREKYAEQAAQTPKPLPPPVKAAGQVVTTEWVIDSGIDDNDGLNWSLIKARPDLIRRVEWNKTEAKRLLTQGVKLPGVIAHEAVKSNVRLTPSSAPIPV
jgi:hypothetical protein